MTEKSGNITIAIDGYSSSGKSTFAKAIAKKMGYIYIDSGAMYRAVTLACLREGLNPEKMEGDPKLHLILNRIEIIFKLNEETGEYETYLNNQNIEKSIRSIEVSEKVSTVSKIKEVRDKMVMFQRKMAGKKSVVMDGRDIGTVVFPDADIKIFMTASADIRADRRYRELLEKGIRASFQEVKDNLIHRDQLDETRNESPLRKAENAFQLDTSNMTQEEQLEWFMDYFREKLTVLK